MSNARNLASFLGTSTTVPSGKVVTASLPTGTVLQVKFATGAGGNSGGVEGSWIDVISLDITPQSTSSNIFAQLSCTGYGSGTGYLSARVRIYNSTSTNVVGLLTNAFFRDGSSNPKAFGSFLQGLDSANSTAAQTYKCQAFIETASNHNLYWETANGAPWTLSLMEIAG